MKVLVFKDGNERLITGEEGKYWLIGEDRVRKLSSQISGIEELSEPVEPKGEKSVPAKKKPAAKKKKAAEAKDDGERSE